MQWELFNEIIEDGMLTGFLLSFCQEHYCCENFEFLLAVKRFHDLFVTSGWTAWRELDSVPASDPLYVQSEKLFDEVFDTVHQEQIKTEISLLWRKYLEPTSATAEVCLPYEILDNTERRMQYYRAYGPDVFAEATLEPTKAMVRDIMPRYLVSTQYMLMNKRRAVRDSLPHGSELKVPSPKLPATHERPRTREAIFAYCCDLDNYMMDDYLYNGLLVYLKKIVSAENLLCYRGIEVFQELMKENSTEDAIAMAWTLYFFFLCVGSSHEVSVRNDVRYDISRKMCNPDSEMFDVIKRSLRIVLDELLVQYRMTIDFSTMLEQFAFGNLSVPGDDDEENCKLAVTSKPSPVFISCCFGSAPIAPT